MYTKKNVILLLVIISIISLGLKIITTDFSIPPALDVYGYILHSFAISQGDFLEPPRKTIGWPIFISVFTQLFEFQHFIDYSNLVRILSISISTLTIYPMYLLARKFFPIKYSIIAAGLFAFEPHLNYNSGQGLSEPLYIAVMILSFYFILQKNYKINLISFLLAGVLWWVRWPGIIMFIVISTIFLLKSKKSMKTIPLYFTCVMIFLLVVSPMLLHRYEQYGDPLYMSLSSNVFTGDYGALMAENTQNSSYSYFDFINDNGIIEFFNVFLIHGFTNLSEQLIKISFPYLIFLLPFGILFSLRPFDQNPKFIKYNWILILFTLGISLISFSIAPERRHIYFLFPFLIIIAVIPIQRLIEYGVSTFSFSNKQKNIILFIIMLIIFVLSFSFTFRYDVVNDLESNEKIEFNKTLLENKQGKIIINNDDWRYAAYIFIDSIPDGYENIKLEYVNNRLNIQNHEFPLISLHADTINELLITGEEYDLQYIVVHSKMSNPWYKYLDDVYENEENYPYLTKIIDTSKNGYQTLHTKVFKIDYAKFHFEINRLTN